MGYNMNLTLAIDERTLRPLGRPIEAVYFHKLTFHGGIVKLNLQTGEYLPFATSDKISSFEEVLHMYIKEILSNQNTKKGILNTQCLLNLLMNTKDYQLTATLRHPLPDFLEEEIRESNRIDR